MTKTSASTESSQSTTIGASCRINGDLTMDGDATVFGSVSGRVEVSGDLELGETGEVLGPVHAGSLVSRGKIEGEVSCDHTIDLQGSIAGTVVCGETVHIGPQASLVGDLFARSVSIADGATYRGHLVIAPDATEEAQRVFARGHGDATAESVPFSGGKLSELKPVADGGAAEVGQTIRRRGGLLTRAGA